MQEQIKSISYYEKSEKSKHFDFISAQNNCVLCGTVLELPHLVDHKENEVTEDATCPHCKVKARSKKYGLH